MSARDFGVIASVLGLQERGWVVVSPAEMRAGYRLLAPGKFKIGERVTKISGSSWTGLVVGTYSTTLTPEGYCVESENEPGSVQIYPATALRNMRGTNG